MADCFNVFGLPEDALICVLHRLDHEDILRFGATCRVLRKVAHSDCVWMPICSRWEEHVNVNEWRNHVNSALALFKLLRSFGQIVGLWSAKELSPRGGLLYVTWGNLCLIACRVLVGESGDLLLRRLFELVGLRDGSFKLELITAYTNDHAEKTDIRFPGSLVWSSTTEASSDLEINGWPESLEWSSTTDTWFYLELDGLCEMDRFTHDYLVQDQEERNQFDSCGQLDIGCGINLLITDADTKQDINAHRRFEITRRLLHHRFALGDDYQQNNLPLPTYDFDAELNIGNADGLGLESSTVSRRIARSLYCRLTIEEPETGKELSGLWRGVYGPHGIEILNVTYTNEEIIGTKVLGDPNVPCGQVSFRVRISTEITQVPVELQRIIDYSVFTDNIHFDVVKLYDGFGRIADHNFQNPQWVIGKLLVNQNGEIAFLWEDEDFTIPFQRVDLGSLYKSQKAVGQIL